MTQKTTARVFRFGAFELNQAAGELRKHGIRIKLHSQPFQVLLMLLERPTELVTREEMRQRLWGDDTIVDFDHGLNTAVNKLREALGDAAARPRHVETVPGRGYRFIAPVTVAVPAATAVVESAAADSTASAATAHGRCWRRTKRRRYRLPLSLPHRTTCPRLLAHLSGPCYC